MAYTTIDDPSAYFQTKIYSGDGNDDRDITYDGNSDMQPDWLWFKRRNQVVNHILFDSTRGVTKRNHTNNANAEATETNFLQAFNSNGFQVGTDADINASDGTYVSWGWKANGGTTASNSDGSITSTVQASTTAGFSIVTYTGNASVGATIGHGLGVVPNVVLVKGRSVGDSWTMLHSGIASDFETDMIKLDETAAAQDNSVFWNDTAPTSSVFSVDGAGGEAKVNESGSTYVAYCFANIQGYSKFGSYTGNGNADGPFIYLGFQPAWLLIKNISSAGNSWVLLDNKRQGFNVENDFLFSNASDAESVNLANHGFDFLSNGFKNRGTGQNDDGDTFIYMAFAESPFVSSEGVPTTAR